MSKLFDIESEDISDILIGKPIFEYFIIESINNNTLTFIPKELYDTINSDLFIKETRRVKNLCPQINTFICKHAYLHLHCNQRKTIDFKGIILKGMKINITGAYKKHILKNLNLEFDVFDDRLIDNQHPLLIFDNCNVNLYSINYSEGIINFRKGNNNCQFIYNALIEPYRSNLKKLMIDIKNGLYDKSSKINIPKLLGFGDIKCDEIKFNLDINKKNSPSQVQIQFGRMEKQRWSNQRPSNYFKKPIGKTGFFYITDPNWENYL